MEGLEGAFDVAFRSNSGHVESMAAGSRGQSEFFHPVDKVGTSVLAGHWLNNECLVFKSDEASAGMAVQVLKTELQSIIDLSNTKIDRMWLSLMNYVTTAVAFSPLLWKPVETLKTFLFPSSISVYPSIYLSICKYISVYLSIY